MVASLVTRSLTVSRGPQVVLTDVDLTLTPGRRVGLIGPNGVGKSTLLSALAGTLDSSASIESGTIDVRPLGSVVGLMPQEALRSPDETARQFLARRTGVSAVQHELDSATERLAVGAAGADDDYAAALERWLRLGAPDFDARAESTWADLGLDEGLLERPTAVLSGGEAARVSLASMLLSRYDVVLLDEPTNDLDLDGLARLETWVIGLNAPTVIVSHDRTFMERTITDVVEIDHHSHRTTWFSGGWAAFLEERETARRHARERFEQYDTQRSSLLARAQREREWATRGRARVRRSDEPDKNIRAFKIDQTEQLAGRAARTERAIERLDEVDEPHEAWELRLTIPTTGRSGDLVAEARSAVVRRGTFQLGPLDLTVVHGDRIAFVGANGSGKTTLIDLLLGRIEPDDGTVRTGASVVLGEISQARHDIDPAGVLVEAFMAAVGDVRASGSIPGELAEVVATSVGGARTLLAKFGLAAEHVGRPVASLSPGERTRAAMALLMATGANLLVLDEPTNHLDIEAIEQLEQALDAFEGTVLLVTHDRSMLDRVRLTRRVELSDGRISSDS